MSLRGHIKVAANRRSHRYEDLKGFTGCTIVLQGEPTFLVDCKYQMYFQDMTVNIASHVLVFMVVGINSHIKKSIAHFGTRTGTSDELFPLFWQAIAYLEMVCLLKVNTYFKKLFLPVYVLIKFVVKAMIFYF